jgi:tetratricopeptide (TPR) repeat protein
VNAVDTARAAHRLVREHVLVGPFQDDAFDVAATLRGGPYNCLTATIVFDELCRRQGLAAVAMFVPGHVFTRIESAAPFDVQITCADWYTCRDPHSILLPAGAEKAIDTSAAARQLADADLVARMYYNRGVRAHRDDDCAAAVELLRTAVELDPRDDAAGRNLSAAINNLALRQCERGEYVKALATLETAARRPAGQSPVRENEVYIRGCWADALCRRGRFEQAAAVLREGQRRDPNEVFFARALQAVEEAKRQHADRRPILDAPVGHNRQERLSPSAICPVGDLPRRRFDRRRNVT